MILSDSFKQGLEEKAIEALYDEPMKNHTSFKIGGNAKVIVIPKSIAELKYILEICKKENLPYYIMGNGTNLLALDEGVDGVVIKIRGGMAHIFCEGEKIYAGAGALLSKVSDYACERSLSGMEEISGIFGCIGGAVYMNAGAYGAEMKDIVESVTYITPDGSEHTVTNAECAFGYRKSIFSDSDKIICEVVLKLKHGKKEDIKEKMIFFGKKRAEKQPLNFPNCGSTFKRPEGNFAGALIEKANLKGVSVGGAAVSEKHAGFVINTGGATSRDVLDLIKLIKDSVYSDSGVMLECEMKTIPPIKH